MTVSSGHPAEQAEAERAEPGPRWAERVYQLSALVCTLVAAALWTAPTLVREHLYDGDANHHIFWLYKYADPLLFPNDLSVEYFSSHSVAPMGYRGLYSVLAPHLDVLFAAKLVALVLYVITLWMAWLVGRSLVRNRKSLAGLVALVVVVVLIARFDLLPPTGLQRVFALPITLLLLWALMSRRYIWAGVSWVLAALVYPVLIPVLGLTAGVVFLRDLVRDRRLPAMWQWNGLLGLAAIAFVLFGSGMPDGVGPMVTYDQARAMDEFGPAGRQSLFDDGGMEALFEHHRTGLGWAPSVLMWFAAAAGFAWLFGPRKPIPLAPWVLVAVGVGLWFAARLTLFHLYLPNRHSRFAIAAFGMVALCVAVVTVANALYERIGGSGKLVTLALAAVGPILIASLLWPQAAEQWTSTPLPNQEAAYEFIAKLPRDTVVAAHPNVADDVPLRTHRSVLASTETSIAFATGYYERLVPRIEASLEATYATTWDDFEAALKPYDVDVFLVRAGVYEEFDPYYAPFRFLTSDLWAKGQAEGFVLQNPPPDRVLFRSGDTYVVRVEPASA